MIQRFQIEDLIVQDPSGVVFRAVDTETGAQVAVRRFFPFGADGGGLSPDEQTAYDIAIRRLSGIRHPALRSVIAGGCDPVDGMPFIATEWVEGEPLFQFVERGPLPVPAAVDLLNLALEVSQVLSDTLSEEAVWVETDLSTIIIGSPESGRPFTFWISPLKWLGSAGENKGMESIVDLTERIMHWKGKKVGDETARGMGGWMKWLRATPATSLREAREALAAAIGAGPVRKVPSRPRLPLRNSPKKGPSRPKTFLIVNTSLACIAICLVAWIYLQKQAREGELPDFIPTSIRHRLPDPKAGPVAVEAESQETPGTPPPAAVAADPAPVPPVAAAPPEPPLEPIAWNNTKLLLAHKDKPVIVGGQLQKVGRRNGSQYLYLEFSKSPRANDFCGIIQPKTAPPELAEISLRPLIGKRIRIHGTLTIRGGSGYRRPEIRIGSRDAIEVLE